MIPLLVEEGRGGGIDWKTQKKCARCHELIPTDVEPCRFPSSTAPASLAALNLHLGNEASWSTGPKVFCHKCWVWIYNLSICWACGETVVRGEEKNPIPSPTWTNDPRGIALRKLPLCRHCIDDLAFLKIEIVHDNLPAMPLPAPALPSQPESSESYRRPTPKWMDKLPSNRRASKDSAPRIPEDLTPPPILEPSAPPSILKQPPSPRVSKQPSKSTASPSSSPPSTTMLLPPDSAASSYTTNDAIVVIPELRAPIRSSSIRKTFADAAASTRASARRRRRRRYASQSSPYVVKDMSACFSPVGIGGGE